MEHGAIISIVNKDQMTCCEMAAAHEHKMLADVIEVALVFQPTDDTMAAIDAEQRFSHENQSSLLVLDSRTHTIEELSNWSYLLVIELSKLLEERPSRIETLLDYCGWDEQKLISEWEGGGRESLLKSCALQPSSSEPTVQNMTNNNNSSNHLISEYYSILIPDHLYPTVGSASGTNVSTNSTSIKSSDNNNNNNASSNITDYFNISFSYDADNSNDDISSETPNQSSSIFPPPPPPPPASSISTTNLFPPLPPTIESAGTTSTVVSFDIALIVFPFHANHSP